MLLSKSDRALFAGCALLIQAIAALPVLGAEPAPLDPTVLGQATAQSARQHQQRPAAPSEQQAQPAEPDASNGDVLRGVQSGDTKLPGAPPAEPPLGLTMRPMASDGFVGAADTTTTSFVFSATVNSTGP